MSDERTWRTAPPGDEPPSRLSSFFSQRALRRAERRQAEGRQGKAVDLYARAGAYHRAARAAVEAGDERQAIECSLLAAYGSAPPEQCRLGALRVAELLAASGHHAQAIGLFELAGAYRQAAESARALHQYARAARLYERAQLWTDAATSFEHAGRLPAALEMLAAEAQRLRRAGRSLRNAEARLAEVEARRADLLVRLGRRSEAMEVLQGAKPTPAAVDLLAAAGRVPEAIEAALALGDGAHAARLLRRSPGLDRPLVARVYLACGRPIEAGDILAAAGRSREAAEAYETGQDWPRAGSRWEAAGERERAARAYEKGGRLTDAIRCFTAAGKPAEAAACRARTAAGPRTRQQEPARADALPGAPGAVTPAPHSVLPGLTATAAPFPAAAAPASSITPAAGKSAPGTVAATPAPPRTAPAAALRGGGAAGPAPGQRLLAGRYLVLEQLGRGGMGRVYKAYDRELDELVAIKMLLDPAEGGQRDEDTERLLREVRICRRITHPNVVRVFDLGRCEEGVFITMELLAGERLDNVLAREGALPLPRVKSILEQAGAGLAEAHALGVVHRDLKPGNVILDGARLKLLDFGIARLAERDVRLTRTGFVLGSVHYIAPEQLQGAEPDMRSDLYSLGVLAHTMIAGREPFLGAGAAEVALQHLQQPPPDLRQARPGLPAGWPELVGKLMAKQPGDRFQSIGEALAALAPLAVE